MSLAIINSRTNVGIAAIPVTVETHLSNGLPKFTIVGLPETAVKESKDRVRSAIIQSGFEFPQRRITVNLAPADLPKEGGHFDLPIAISILIASSQLVCKDIASYEFAGELALSGNLRAIKGVLPMAIATQAKQHKLMLPYVNAQSASLVDNLTVFGAKDLKSICEHLSNLKSLTPTKCQINHICKVADLCFSDITGQAHAKRAMEIAAAGKHSILMVGPPGTGKTMLAARLTSILPPLTQQQALDVEAIYSICNNIIGERNFYQRPFRQPHHTSSGVSLVGGGAVPKPGEISLAHFGVLFLDELPEFDRKVLEVLREPLESGRINLSRAKGHAVYPANCQLVAAMNPCPCGYLTDLRKDCQCTIEQVQRYKNKISGPLLDRIDMHVEVPALLAEHLTAQNQPQTEETSLSIQNRVIQAHNIQLQRSNISNAMLNPKQIKKYCPLEKSEQKIINDALEKLGLSARAYHRILKLARTISDLAQSENIKSEHLLEAISYRKMDRANYL